MSYSRRKEKLNSLAKSLFVIAIICATLYLGHVILMPIIFSAFIAAILLPFVSLLERLKLGAGLSAFIAVLLSSAILFGLFLLIAVQTNQIIEELPLKGDVSARELIKQPTTALTDELNPSLTQYKELIDKGISQFKKGAASIFKDTLIRLKDTVVFFVTVPIYIFFLLLYRNNLYRFFKELFRENNLANGKSLLDDAKSVLQAYLKGLFFVILVIAILTSTGLFLLGIKYALVIGLISALLTLIPFIGVVMSALIPISVALVTKDSVWYAVGVAGIYALVQFLEGNIITPKIMGNTVNINPLVIIIALVLMGALTGIVGMILTIPILAVIKVVTNHYPHLKAWQILLEEKAEND
jgi:predicted PurR-regulated permease PerM